ncbi:hypothetical protein LBWT_53750 [Leptolyngbya boryana IAM M-101]|nr:hypothetical protein LBWT_53750 [Leptolyngbya boryana IAM M-101]BAS65753.1 hypothetical protein LBDG_53750 [Leptolyngbya boryana dg5]
MSTLLCRIYNFPKSEEASFSASDNNIPLLFKSNQSENTEINRQLARINQLINSKENLEFLIEVSATIRDKLLSYK